MYKHIVCHRYKTQEGAQKAAALLRALPAQIPELISMEVGLNERVSERAYDLALIATFADEAELDIYLKHSAHLAVREQIHPLQAGSVCVDYHC